MTQVGRDVPGPFGLRPEGTPGDGPASADPPERPARGGGRRWPHVATEPAPEAAPSAGRDRHRPLRRPSTSSWPAAALPRPPGSNWLAEKGYRTVLDLRESAEVSPAFIAEVASRGLRYVALPVDLKSLDRERLARFQFELAAGEARPLFFFDSDGSRAGALWYIRRVTVDRSIPRLARREAEDLGLKDTGGLAGRDRLRAAAGSRPSARSRARPAAAAGQLRSRDARPTADAASAGPRRAVDSRRCETAERTGDAAATPPIRVLAIRRRSDELAARSPRCWSRA